MAKAKSVNKVKQPTPNKSNPRKDFARARKQYVHLTEKERVLQAEIDKIASAFRTKLEGEIGEMRAQLEALQKEMQELSMKYQAAANKKTERQQKELKKLREMIPGVRERMMHLAEQMAGKDTMDEVDGEVDTSVEGPLVDDDIQRIIDEVETELEAVGSG